MFRRLGVVLVAAALLMAGCGGGDSEGVAVGSTSTTTDSVPATSTTAESTLSPPTTRGPAPTVTVDPLGALGGISVLTGEPLYRGVLGQVDPDRHIVAPVALPPAAAPDGIAPLTGLPASDTATVAEPALLVKVDNTPKGRPQEALAQADLVYEEMIEGGFTRLAVVYHSQTPVVGPVRSGRTTDIALLGSLNGPVFVWSGANLVHAALLRRQNMVDLGAQTRSEYTRSPDRPSTYDLMTDTAELREIAAGREDGGAPPPHFEYRNDVTGLPESATPSTGVTVSFPSVTASWDWDASASGWVRTQGSTPHVDAQGNPVVAANVLVAEVPDVATGSVDTAGSTVFEQQFLGRGRGWAFTDGHVVEVTWTKSSIHSVPTWTTADNVPVALTPGITWVELAPIGATTPT